MRDSRLKYRNRVALNVASLVTALLHPILMVRHRAKLGYWANPAWPRRYSEKMLWRKLFDHNPLFVRVTDKLSGRAYVTSRLPDLPQPALIWSGTSAADIPDSIMHGPAIIKATNSSGANFVLRDGQPDRNTIDRRTHRLLRPGGLRRKEEWAYGPIEGQLIAEELLPLGGGNLPTDLKVYVAAGKACCVWATDKLGHRSLTLSPDGTPLPGRDEIYPNEADALPFTDKLGDLSREAARLALPLAADFDMVRVDFLVTESGLYGGELTIYSSGGYDTWTNPEISARIEKAWDLRRSDFLKRPHSGLLRHYCEALIAAETARLDQENDQAPRFF
jgi:hypothetical protein